MPVITRQIGPCLAAEVEGLDMTRPLSPERGGGDPRRHGPVRRAGVPRPGRSTTSSSSPSRGAWGRSSTRSARASRAPERVTGCPPPSPTCRTSTSTTASSRGTTGGGCSRSATACGTPTARSRRSRRSTRCCTRAASRRRAATRSSPTCGRPTTPSTRRRRPRSRPCSASTRSSSRASSLGFTDFTEEERGALQAGPAVPGAHAPGDAGGRSLYLSSHAGGIVGWPVPEARAFLRDLVEHATQRQFVYAHRWRVGDLVMWDNRQTMHRARPFPRTSRATCGARRCAGDGPTARSGRRLRGLLLAPQLD